MGCDSGAERWPCSCSGKGKAEIGNEVDGKEELGIVSGRKYRRGSSNTGSQGNDNDGGRSSG